MEVEAIDKAGNFIGWLFVDNTNLSVALVEVNPQLFHMIDCNFYLIMVHLFEAQSEYFTATVRTRQTFKLHACTRIFQ